MRTPIFEAVALLFLCASLLQIVTQISAWRSADQVISFSDVKVPFVLIMPLQVLKFPWTFATASFAESQFTSLLVTPALVLIISRTLEPLWGSRSLLKYIALCSITPVAAAWVIDILLYSATRSERYTNRTIGGGTGLIVASLVALKQMFPLQTYVLFRGAFRIQLKYLIMPTLLFYTIAGIVVDFTLLVMAWTALLVSWIYLRFVKSIVSETLLPSGTPTILKGDKSDAFAFAKFFYPAPMTAAVAGFTTEIYRVLVSAKLVKSFDEDQVSASNSRIQAGTAAGRHRALGLEAMARP